MRLSAGFMVALLLLGMLSTIHHQNLKKLVEDYPMPSKTLESNGADSFSPLTGGWDFSRAYEWSDFALADKDSVELVIGVQPRDFLELQSMIRTLDGVIVDSVFMGEDIRAAVADVPFESVSALTDQLREADLSTYIEPNLGVQVDFVPNDRYWGYQWGPVIIGADYAWNTTKDESTVLVAIIDTGIDYNHPDLAANYVPVGSDWVNDDEDPKDDVGHGTFCAGIVAGVLNNEIGIAGLAQVQIMAEKGLDYEGQGWETGLAKAIVHAVDTMEHMGRKRKILNLSWGSRSYSILIHDAIKYAYDHGVLVVASAGNEGSDNAHYPATLTESVAVTATDPLDNPTEWTSFGNWVEVAAPGENIISTSLDNSYVYGSGTSFSAACATGVAALIWSQFPWMTRDQVRAQLRYTADDKGLSDFDVYYGYGRVNARHAVEHAPPEHDLAILDWQQPQYVKPGDQVNVNSTLLNFGTDDESNIVVQLLVDGSIIASEQIDFLESGATNSCSLSANLYVSEGLHNMTTYVIPLPGETTTENNALSFLEFLVRFPITREVPKNYETIQDALDDSYPDDTILVTAGWYFEHLTINKPLSLRSQGGTTVIDGSGYGTVVRIIADNVDFDGFTIRNGDCGISIYSCDEVTLSNNIVYNNTYGIVIYYSFASTLRNNEMTANIYNFKVSGRYLSTCVQDIDTSNTVDGKPIYYWVNHHNERVPSDAGYIAAVNSTGIFVKDLNLTRNGQGVLFAHTNSSTIENVNAVLNEYGILLIVSHDNTICSSSPRDIELWYSEGNEIRDNQLINWSNTDGIHLLHSHNNSIVNNIVTSKCSITRVCHGVLLESSTGNTIRDNTISDNSGGVNLDRSGHNILKGNHITGNEYNFGIHGYELSDFTLDIDESNTINGKPIYYLTNQSDLTVDYKIVPNMGYLGIVNSINVTIRNLTFEDNIQGILLAHTDSCAIDNVISTNNEYGIYVTRSHNCEIFGCQTARNTHGVRVSYSSNCTVAESLTDVSIYASTNSTVRKNTITASAFGFGITVSYSSGCTIDDNSLTDTDFEVGYHIFLENSTRTVVNNNTIVGGLNGIVLENCGGNNVTNNKVYGENRPGQASFAFSYSRNNIVVENTALGGFVGILLHSSSANTFYHNNFISLTTEATGGLSVLTENIWDNGREEGNYWSKYHGEDSNNDGVGDTSHYGFDEYPLMKPYMPGDVNHDGQVNVVDLSAVAMAYWTTPGHPNWYIHADISPPYALDDLINTLDLAMVASHFGEKWVLPSPP